MEVYQSKFKRSPGTRYKEVYDEAYQYYLKIKKRTKREPYVRSNFFRRQKIFLNLFWRHLDQKHWKDRSRRLRYFKSAIDLLRNSRLDGISKENPNNTSEIFHRFLGRTQDNYKYALQVKENKRTGRKFLISIFPLRS